MVKSKEVRGLDIPKVSELIETLDTCIQAWLRLPSNPEPAKGAGHFVLRDSTSGCILLSCQLGELSPEEARKHWALAMKMGEALYANKEYICSIDLKKHPDDYFGGGINSFKYIFAFSGLPERGNEAVVLVSAFLTNSMTAHMVYDVAGCVGNTYLPLLLNEIKSCSSPAWCSSSGIVTT